MPAARKEEGDAGGEEIDAVDAEDENGDGHHNEGDAAPRLPNGDAGEVFLLSQRRKMAKNGTRKPWE